MIFSSAILSLLLTAAPALGHIAIWHPSVYGFNASGSSPDHYFDSPINTDFIVSPIRKMDHLPFDQWYFHGVRGATPNAVMELPAGETIMIEHSCNKAWTSYGLAQEQKDVVGDIPCDINNSGGKAHYGVPGANAANGPMHVAETNDARGCALAIAYADSVWDVKPEDFVVFTVQHECVWKKNTYFEIPANMPPAPAGKKSFCSWNWIHGTDRGQGYGDEIYMNGFDCEVTKSKSNAAIAKPKVAELCKDDQSKCVKGAKQTLFWQGAVDQGWNIPEGGLPPFYNNDWGFPNGAQNDIFESSSEPVPQRVPLNPVDMSVPAPPPAQVLNGAPAPASEPSNHGEHSCLLAERDEVQEEGVSRRRMHKRRLGHNSVY